jgi:uncharacterized phage protein (TIGR01671 family)
MSREIKFRIIRFNTKGYFIFGYERLNDAGDWEWMCLELNPDKGERWTPGVLWTGYTYKRDQLTGLKDDDGVDIYEHDIVAIEYDRSREEIERERETDTDQEHARRKTSGVVKWNDHGTGWILETKSSMSVNDRGTVMTSIIHGPDGSRKILGNIWKNPELL